MNKYRIIVFSITVIAILGLPFISYGAQPGEQTLKSEISVGSYTNFTYTSHTVVSVSDHIISNQNYSGYINTTITSLNSNGFNLTENYRNSNGTLTGTYDYTVEFNSTNTDIFEFLNSSYSYLDKLNFTLTETNGTYGYSGVSYPMTKIIARGGTESNASGDNWWFSNQTVEYDPYSGIIFYQIVNTSYTLNNRVTNADDTFTLSSTDVNMGQPASNSKSLFYLEIGGAVAVIAIAGLSVFLLRSARNRRR